MSQVRLEALVKRYGEVAALDGVTLTIRQGEFFSLLGASGCGKTTTLRLIAGFEEPTEGQIHFDDRPMNGVSAQQRNVGMVFQNYALFPHLDVAGNVAFGLKAHHVPAAEIPGRVAEALRLVELEGLEHRAVHDLSGGQQQRVAVARAAVIRPDILLLDEPLSNLDARLRKTTRAALSRIQRSLGATAIYVTHDQDEALALSDRLAVMRDGKIDQIGPPREIYESPQTLHVARFIGETNLLPAHWREASPGALQVDLEAFPNAAFSPPPQALEAFTQRNGRPQPGAPLIVALKPEAFRPAAPEDRPLLELEILTKEYAGSTTSLTGRTKSTPLQARLPSAEAAALRPGELLRLTFSPGQAILFAPNDR